MNEKKNYLVEVSERTSYKLKVQASSEKEARKLVKAINHGDACLSDFEGGETILHFTKLTIHSVAEEP